MKKRKKGSKKKIKKKIRSKCWKKKEEKKRRIPIHGSKRKKRKGKGQVTDRRCV